MKREKLVLLAVLLCCSFLFAGKKKRPRRRPEKAKNPPIMTITQNHADAIYKVGDKVVFTFKIAMKDGAPVTETDILGVNITCTGLPPQKMDLGSAPKQLECEVKKTGFIRLCAIGRSWRGKITYVKRFSVAACEPETLKPAVAMPDDFDAFWEKGRKRLAEIPLDYKQEKVEHLCDENQNTYKVSFANINDSRIHGYMLIPTSGKKTYPAIVSVASAGTGKPRETFIQAWQTCISGNEAICLFMGVYDHELGKPREWYRKNFKGKDGSPGTATEDPEKYFLRRATLGIDRAITWLASRKDVDKSRIVYTGNSQGGGMGLILTGLNKNITAANVNIPAFCDHLGYQAGRPCGYPGILNADKRAKMTPEKVEAIAKMLPYFDAANFARKITVPVIYCMGFQDTTCPPSGVYAAYNVITAPKVMVVDPNQGHGVSKVMKDAFHPWVREKLGLAPVVVENKEKGTEK